MSEKLSVRGVFIWSLAAVFFLYEFFLRVFVGTISDSVLSEMHLTAQQFAIMGAGYYLTYSVMQLPVGILADKYGTRLLLTIAVFLAALGAFWFAFSYSFFAGFLSRCFMGFGSSFAYVCLLVLALNWFPRAYFALMIGIANLLGSLGPILAGGPLAYLLSIVNNNWRLVLIIIGLVGIVLTLIIGLYVRSGPSRKKGTIIHLDTNTDPLLSRLVLLLKNRQVWAVTIFAGFVYVSLPLLGAYWGTAFLQSRGLERTDAAMLTSLLWLGTALSAPLLGKFSDAVSRRKLPLLLCTLLGIVSSLCVIYWPTMNKMMYGLFFFCIGVASSCHVISFALISEHVQKKLHATAIGINNSIIMLFAAILPQVVTFFIHTAGSVEAYSFSAFQQGFILMPIFYLLAMLISLIFIKETFCRQQLEVIKVDF